MLKSKNCGEKACIYNMLSIIKFLLQPGVMEFRHMFVCFIEIGLCIELLSPVSHPHSPCSVNNDLSKKVFKASTIRYLRLLYVDSKQVLVIETSQILEAYIWHEHALNSSLSPYLMQLHCCNVCKMTYLNLELY